METTQQHWDGIALKGYKEHKAMSEETTAYTTKITLNGMVTQGTTGRAAATESTSPPNTANSGMTRCRASAGRWAG